MKKISKICLFLVLFLVLTTGVYAFNKVFHLDEKFVSFFDLNGDEDIKANDVEVKKEFDDFTIYIKQTILDDEKVYVIFDIIGKEQLYYISDTTLSLTNSSLENSNTDDCENTDFCTSATWVVDENENTTSYITSYTTVSVLENTVPLTLTLVIDDKPYTLDISITKENLESVSSLDDVVIYNGNGNFTLTTSIVKATKMGVVFYTDISDVEAYDAYMLEPDIGDIIDSVYITYKDGTKEDLLVELGGVLRGNQLVFNYSYQETFKDITKIESVTINNHEFKLN
jgi:hypothetical protein